MAEPARVSATDFSRDFARYADEANRIGVIEVMRGPLVVGAYLSADELELYRAQRARSRPQVIRAGELDDEALEMLGAAAYGRPAD